MPHSTVFLYSRSFLLWVVLQFIILELIIPYYSVHIPRYSRWCYERAANGRALWGKLSWQHGSRWMTTELEVEIERANMFAELCTMFWFVSNKGIKCSWHFDSILNVIIDDRCTNAKPLAKHSDVIINRSLSCFENMCPQYLPRRDDPSFTVCHSNLCGPYCTFIIILFIRMSDFICFLSPALSTTAS